MHFARSVRRGTGARAAFNPGARSRGFTLLELLIVVAIVGVLSAIAGFVYQDALRRARNTSAISEIRSIEKILTTLEADGEPLPETLAEIGWFKTDPWGAEYRYLRFATAQQGGGEGGKEKEPNAPPKNARRDRFLVPLNSTYDLYSMGADGQSQPPLTSAQSRDDIVRAADGAFVGLAVDF